ALENDHRRGDGRLELGRWKKPTENLAKLLEPGSDLTNILFAGVTNQGEVLRAHADPSVFCLGSLLPGDNQENDRNCGCDSAKRCLPTCHSCETSLAEILAAELPIGRIKPRRVSQNYTNRRFGMSIQ